MLLSRGSSEPLQYLFLSSGNFAKGSTVQRNRGAGEEQHRQTDFGGGGGEADGVSPGSAEAEAAVAGICRRE